MEQRRANACMLYLAVTYYSLWLLALAIIGYHIARPASPEFLSSLIVGNLGEVRDNIAIYILTTMVSSTFQAYILICYAQVTALFIGPIFLFMFTMPDVVAIIPY